MIVNEKALMSFRFGPSCQMLYDGDNDYGKKQAHNKRITMGANRR